jgi:hypothetical protein
VASLAAQGENFSETMLNLAPDTGRGCSLKPGQFRFASRETSFMPRANACVNRYRNGKRLE